MTFVKSLEKGEVVERKESRSDYIVRKQREARGADMVNSPPHYQNGSIETIDLIESMLTFDQFMGYCKGQVLKYMARCEYKTDCPSEDLKKGQWYLHRMIKAVDNEINATCNELSKERYKQLSMFE